MGEQIIDNCKEKSCKHNQSVKASSRQPKGGLLIFFSFKKRMETMKMKQKDYKEIAEIIEKFEFDFKGTDQSNRDKLCNKLADYFEKEVQRINRDREDRYLLEHKGILSEKAKDVFNKKQFLKDCGIEEPTETKEEATSSYPPELLDLPKEEEPNESKKDEEGDSPSDLKGTKCKLHGKFNVNSCPFCDSIKSKEILPGGDELIIESEEELEEDELEEDEEEIEETRNLPEKKFSTGAISTTIWRNEGIDKPTGEGIQFRSVVLERRYIDKEGNWQSTRSLRLNDLPKAILVLQKAYEYIVLKGVD